MKVLGVAIPIFTTEFEAAVKSYEILMGEHAQRQFEAPCKCKAPSNIEVPSNGISVAKVGSVLIIGGSEKTLASLPQIRAIFIVDSLDKYHTHLKTDKATILQPPTPTPTGRNMIVKATDGMVFEYVELRDP